jgi:hypothetical protein
VCRKVVKSCWPMLIVRKWRSGSFLDVIHFRWVAPPLQPGVVGSYPEQGVWFPSRLPLKPIGRV